MTAPKIPYPARRTYKWAYADIVHTYAQARDIFIRMRRQSPESDNPARFKALTLVLDALVHLNHTQDVDTFPGPKLHKLLCKSALAADWCPDLGAKQRAACAQPVEGGAEGEELYRCPKCREIKPLSAFLKAVTPAQRKVWGWNNALSARTTKAKTCNTCRHKAQQRSARYADRQSAKAAIRVYERAVLRGLLTPGSVESGENIAMVVDAWQAILSRALSSTRAARHTAALVPHAPTLAFYDLKMSLLAKAQQNLSEAVEANRLADYVIPAPHWTQCISREDFCTLHYAHAQMLEARREDQVRGRTPAI